MKARINDDGVLEILRGSDWVEQECFRVSNCNCGDSCPALQILPCGDIILRCLPESRFEYETIRRINNEHSS